MATAQTLNDSDRREQVLFDQQVQIPAGQQHNVSFTTHSNLRNGRIAGNVQVFGGSDIRVLVLKGASITYDSGQRRSIVLSVDCSEPGQYTLILDNRSSLLTAKVVTGKISLVEWGVDSERNAADQAKLLVRSNQATRVLGRLFAALAADERVLGTRQLGAQPAVLVKNDSTINAGASWSSNTIQVNKGLFELAERTGGKSDDMVAGVLSHELAHIFYRHPGYGSSSELVKGFIDELTGVTALDRVQEKEADILGIRVACQAGYDPAGMLILVRAFAATNPNASSFMQNHPSGIERLRYLETEAQRCTGSHPVTTFGASSVLNPQSLAEIAPARFGVRVHTTKGDFVLVVTRSWAPLGADRFYNLVKAGFFADCPFFRVVPNFMAQFGISSRPEVSLAWANAKIPDDPVRESNLRGKITFAAGAAPNSRTTQVFINLRDNALLDGHGFAPFGEVVEGMEVVDRIFSGYGEKPLQSELLAQGKAYLDRDFPMVDRVLNATILQTD